MPELPEVECVRRTVARHLVGRRVGSARVIRADVIHGGSSQHDLLAGQHVVDVTRHGKQLAMVGENGGCVTVHLGMSGQLCLVPSHTKRTKAYESSNQDAHLPPHTHLVWCMDDGTSIRFTDPRRFGGVWTFVDRETLVRKRWSKLGPDALEIKPNQLYKDLSRTKRGLKAALLDQAVVAGLGNIYVDELLFKSRLHPLIPADQVGLDTCRGLVRRMRTLLDNAIARGGSSLRDYVDAENQQGSQQTYHRVYGRAGKRCTRRACRETIMSDQVAGRTTAWCPACQPVFVETVP